MKKLVNPFVYDKVINQNLSTPTITDYITPTYAQCYEDIIIESILRSWMRTHNKDIKEFSVVEVGGNHPVSCSSSYYLEEKYGMGGFIVEANPKLAAVLTEVRKGMNVLNCAVHNGPETELTFYVNSLNEVSSLSKEFADSWSGQNGAIVEAVPVKTRRINDILSMSRPPIALLSIDVEGIDYEILSDVDFIVHRPVVVQVEPSDGFKPGTSQKMIDFMKRANYTLISETDVNLIFLVNNE